MIQLINSITLLVISCLMCNEEENIDYNYWFYIGIIEQDSTLVKILQQNNFSWISYPQVLIIKSNAKPRTKILCQTLCPFLKKKEKKKKEINRYAFTFRHDFILSLCLGKLFCPSHLIFWDSQNGMENG